MTALEGADIDAPGAWAASTGGGVTVAVVDTGLHATHEDLAGRAVAGWNFVDGNDDTTDGHGHGTHVAGTIAAVKANGLGIAGVAPDAQVMALKALADNGQGYGSDAIAAFDYASDHGVRVVNASLGGTGYLHSEYDAIAAHPETLYVVAAGNSGTDNDVSSEATYPCAYDLANVICVGASTPRDERASFSNYGRTSVDLFAPGVEILSTLNSDSGYGLSDGTSMAAPHVAGIAALLLASDPSLTGEDARQAILGGADRKSALSGWSATGGRANAPEALDYIGDVDGDGARNGIDACREEPGTGADGCPPTGTETSAPTATTPTPTAPMPTQPPPATAATPPALPDRDGRPDISDSCPTGRASTANGCPLPALTRLTAKVSRSHKRGRTARLTVRVDRAATVRITVTRRQCRRGCCGWVRVSRRILQAPSGLSRLTLRRLKRGAHRAIAVPSSAAGTGTARTSAFRIR